VKSFPLEAVEKCSRQELADLQLERLRGSLKHAYENVPLYRRKFDAAGVKPEDCRSLQDLARFPLTAKADLRETYPFGMFAVPMEKIVRIHASSGTTGKPTVVGYTAKATAFSPAGSARTTARSGSAWRWSRWAAA
jgi:phenylacetate-CoA ligase